MLMQALLKVNYSLPYHQRVSHQMNFRLAATSCSTFGTFGQKSIFYYDFEVSFMLDAEKGGSCYFQGWVCAGYEE